MNNSLANVKLSRTQLSKNVQSGGLLGRLLGPLLKTDLPLMKNVLKLLAKSISILGQEMIKILISNEEMSDIMKIVKSLQEFSLLIKGVSKIIKNEGKLQKKWISWHVIRYIRS